MNYRESATEKIQPIKLVDEIRELSNDEDYEIYQWKKYSQFKELKDFLIYVIKKDISLYKKNSEIQILSQNFSTLLFDILNENGHKNVFKIGHSKLYEYFWTKSKVKEAGEFFKSQGFKVRTGWIFPHITIKW